MRQHWLADNIANSKNMRHIGTHLFIHRDKTIFIYRYTRVFSADIFTVRATTNGNQDAVIDLRFNCILAFKADMDAIFFWLHAGNLSAQHDFLETFLHTLLQWANQVTVAALNQAVS